MAKTAINKAEQKAVKLFDYMSECLDNMDIRMDEYGAFALIPSERKEVRYKVRFDEPRNEVARAVDCSCYDHRVNGNTCKHMHIVNTWLIMMHDVTAQPTIYGDPTVAPEVSVPAPVAIIGNAEMDALVAQLEADFGLVEEVLPVVLAKKVRRSAKNETLCKELRAPAKVGIAQVRKAFAKVPNTATKVTEECPVVVRKVA